MSIENVPLLAFNRGLVSPRALARVDLKRLALSAETMTNWMARKLGSMMLRPGLAFVGNSASNNQARHIPFIFATTDTAIVELTNLIMRVWVADALVTRASVSTTVANGGFDTDLTSWTDSDESGSTSAWVTGGYLGLTGDGTTFAIREQTLTVAGGDQNVEHALRFTIERGPVIVRVGSTSGGDEYITETRLGTGVHSLAFTPTGASVFVLVKSSLKRQVLVDAIAIEAAGVMTLPSPYPTADLRKVTFDESADVIYLGGVGYQQRKIERRATNSWSLVLYQADDGPFRPDNFGPATITPSALSGNITLTASAPLFKSTNVGGIWRVTSSGQTVTASVSAENSFTNTILVTGVTTQRIFQLTGTGITGSSTTVTLQRSFTADTGPFEDYANYTTDQGPVSIDDGLDNQIVWYRFGVKTGNYSSGTQVLTLDYAVGSIDGIVRITAYTSETVVSAEVLFELGDTAATDLWAEGRWSDRRGWPGAVALAEGRLWWAGKDGVFGSVSDGYESFDPLVEGDSGPITRNVGSGPVDIVPWLLSLQRLLIGAQGIIYTAKSNSLDEPLTPTNISIKVASTRGTAQVPAKRIDKQGIFAHLGATRLMELTFDPTDYEYAAKDLTELVPDLFNSPAADNYIVAIDVQRSPDTRIHCVKADGSAGVVVWDPTEKVLCWLEVTSPGGTGLIEDVIVIPAQEGQDEDQVYYSVKRTINSADVRFLEKWATENQCIGGTITRLADSHVVYSGIGASTTLTGLTHLEGETVVVWGNGKDLGTKVVTSGQITGLSESVTDACVGLAYTAQWKSAKLAHAASLGTALGQPKNIPMLGVILANTHYQGLKYGRDFSNLNELPLVVDGKLTAADTVYTDKDLPAFAFDGTWDTDSRLCLQAASPRPASVLAAIVDLQTHDRY